MEVIPVDDTVRALGAAARRKASRVTIPSAICWAGHIAALMMFVWRGVDNLSQVWILAMTAAGSFGFGMAIVAICHASAVMREFRLLRGLLRKADRRYLLRQIALGLSVVIACGLWFAGFFLISDITPQAILRGAGL